MSKFYITFGQKYRSEPHPTLGRRRYLPDGYYTITAETREEAAQRAQELVGIAYSSLYELTEEDAASRSHYFPFGELGDLAKVIASSVKDTRSAASYVHPSAPRAKAVRHADALEDVTDAEWLRAYHSKMGPML